MADSEMVDRLARERSPGWAWEPQHASSEFAKAICEQARQRSRDTLAWLAALTSNPTADDRGHET